MRFIIDGQAYSMDKVGVENLMHDVIPDPICHYWVIMHRRRYPPNQVLEHITRLPRVECRTVYSVTILARLGFKIHRYAK